jgi:hypothetical protein
LTTCAKIGGQEEKKFKKKGTELDGSCIDLQPAGDQRSSAGQGWTLDLSGFVPSFEIFEIFFEIFFGSLGNGPRLLGEWLYSTPIF